MEKVGDHGFLFGVEVGIDHQRLAVRAVRVERDLLGAFLRLEAARMVLWLSSFSGKGLKSQGKLYGALDCFPVLDAFDIALVGVFVGGANSDDPLGSGHLPLEVGVVRDGNELGKP